MCIRDRGSAALDVLDLDGHALQALAGVAVLLHPQRAVRVVIEGHGGLLVLHHGDVLGGVLADQVELRGRPLIHGIVPRFRVGDDDGAALVGGEAADGVPVGADHFKNSPGQRGLGARLQFDDAQGTGAGGGGVRRIGCVGGAGSIGHVLGGVGADGVDADGRGGVGGGHIVLEIAVLVLLRADGIEDGVLVHVGVEGELDAAALALDGVGGVQHLELAHIALAGDALGGDGGDILVVQVHDPGACGGVIRV